MLKQLLQSNNEEVELKNENNLLKLQIIEQKLNVAALSYKLCEKEIEVHKTKLASRHQDLLKQEQLYNTAKKAYDEIYAGKSEADNG